MEIESLISSLFDYAILLRIHTVHRDGNLGIQFAFLENLAHQRCAMI